MRKIILIFIGFLTLNSCSDKKIYRYEYKDAKIELNNYFYSEITSSSADFIEVKCGGDFEIMFEAKNTLIEVKVENNKILIYLRKGSKKDELKTRIKNVCGIDVEYIELNKKELAEWSHKRYLEYEKEKKKE